MRSLHEHAGSAMKEEQSRKEEHEGTFPYRLITTMLLFGLLAEWLMPWVGSTDWAVIYHPAPLLAIIAAIMAAGLFRMPWPLLTLTHAMIILFSLMWLFKSGDESGLQWLLAFPMELWDQIGLVLQNGLWAMSGELQTLLLFTGWAMLAPALQSILWMRQVVLSIAALTIAYLVALHIWAGMDVLGNLLRTSAEGLLLAAIVAVPRVRRLLQVSGGRTEPQRLQPGWLGGAVFLTCIIVGAAMLASVGKESGMAPPSWTASMTQGFQQGMDALSKERIGVTSMSAAKPGELSSGLTGYGFDDSVLGAPIGDDHTLLFKALSPVAAYWRGEAKTIYDGRGWSNGNEKLTLLPVNSEYDETVEAYSANRDQLEAAVGSNGVQRGRLVEQTVIWSKPMPSMPVFASGFDGQVSELIAADPRRKLGSYLVSGRLGAIYAPSETAKLERYKVQSRLPMTDPEKLGEADEAESAMSAEDRFSLAAALEPYLQLPAELPERVFALASEIGGGGVTSQYDRVKAVEQFLKDSYTYTKENVSAPSAGEDFVDDFLFNQKQGYCVHFSTAMVVLLRAQGIPARWVKGFTAGELAEQQGGSSGSGSGAAGNALYEVRGSDAHAWVEVYFPGAGWAPFDPTPGFDGVDLAVAASGAVGGGEAAAAAETGATAAVGDGKLSLARLAAGFEAGAVHAASGAARGAHALAHAARSAVGAAAASPAASAAAGGAALALAGAAALAAQRRQLRLRLALRRYGAAAPSAGALAAGRGATAALIRAEEQQRHSLIAAAYALIDLLQHRVDKAAARGGAGLAKRRRSSAAPVPSADSPLASSAVHSRTVREQCSALGESLTEEQRMELGRINGWLEEARFGPVGKWHSAPSASELAAACKKLTAVSVQSHRTSIKRSSFSRE